MISSKRHDSVLTYNKENITIYIITISSLIGVILGRYYPYTKITYTLSWLKLNSYPKLNDSFLAIVIWVILYVVIRIKRNQKFSFTSSSLIILFFTYLGYTDYKIQNTTNNKTHYSRYTNNLNLENWQFIHFSIEKNLKPTTYYYKQVVNIEYLNDQKTSGKAVIYLPKNSYNLS